MTKRYRPRWNDEEFVCGNPVCAETLGLESFKTFVCWWCGGKIDSDELKRLGGHFLEPGAKKWLTICRRLEISPGKTTSDEYSFGDARHMRLLEAAFPGCTVVWDHHPVTRKWNNFYLKALSHWQVHRPLLRAFKLNDNGSLDQVRGVSSLGGSYLTIHADYSKKDMCWVVFR